MKRRIDLTRYAEPLTENVSGGAITSQIKEVLSNSMELQEVIDLLKQNQTVFWVSEGKWSMHQMLMSILNFTGAAKVMISSYAMSETPARILSLLKDQEHVSSLKVVLDNRVDVRSAGSLQIMKSMSDELALVHCHAKVTLIQNDHWQITVIGSANYTENERFEAGVVTTCPHAYEINKRWITKALKHGVKQ